MKINKDKLKIALLEEKIYFLENIIRKMPGHVYWKNVEGVMQGCNDNQAYDVGLEHPKKIIGLTAFNDLSQSNALIVQKNDQEVVSKGISITAEETNLNADGKLETWLSQKVPLKNQDGIITGILGISIDITEKKRLEEHLVEALNTITLISASFAHELRTPLSTIRHCIISFEKYIPTLFSAYEKLKNLNALEEMIPPAAMAAIKQGTIDIQYEIKKIFTFVNMLLTSIREGGFEQIEFSTYSVSRITEAAINSYPLESEQKLLVHVDIKDDFNFSGNEQLFTHVIYNLLRNALYYIAAANKGKITISTRIEKNCNTLIFEDTGSGISIENLPHIFERFFTKTHHGAGIGLAFCKKVMQSMDGEITCESKFGEYTKFILTFPKLTI